MTRRQDLPTDPATALAAVEQKISALRAQEEALLPVRAQIRREIAGTQRGGVARLAATAGVSHPQAGRWLVEDLVRAVRAAASGVGLERHHYVVRTVGQAQPARVTLSLAWDIWAGPEDAGHEASRSIEIGALNTAGALLDALRRADLDVAGNDARAALASGDAVTVTWT